MRPQGGGANGMKLGSEDYTASPRVTTWMWSHPQYLVSDDFGKETKFWKSMIHHPSPFCSQQIIHFFQTQLKSIQSEKKRIIQIVAINVTIQFPEWLFGSWNQLPKPSDWSCQITPVTDLGCVRWFMPCFTVILSTIRLEIEVFVTLYSFSGFLKNKNGSFTHCHLYLILLNKMSYRNDCKKRYQCSMLSKLSIRPGVNMLPTF